MRLHQIQFHDDYTYAGRWQLCPCELDRIHLLVGKNASGKSRTLASIKALAEIFRGSPHQLFRGRWVASFIDGASKIEYDLAISADGGILSEQLTVDGRLMLERQADGFGQIAGRDSDDRVRFQVPKSAVGVVAKRDLFQYPFLEPLHQWASLLRYYPFGSEMGRRGLVIIVDQGQSADPADWQYPAGLFRRGQKEFGEKFGATVCSYMGRLEYPLLDIRLEPMPASTGVITTDMPLPGPLQGIAVKESDLSGWTWQLDMSQGMFRALAILIHLAYAELASKYGCMLIDDIGEGLDYERSALLIQILMDAAQKNDIQVLMATNDRFIMNAVPLDAWAVIRRTGSKVQILNHTNATQVFEDFKLTGLNNFDFFKSRFFEQAELPSCS